MAELSLNAHTKFLISIAFPPFTEQLVKICTKFQELKVKQLAVAVLDFTPWSISHGP